MTAVGLASTVALLLFAASAQCCLHHHQYAPAAGSAGDALTGVPVEHPGSNRKLFSSGSGSHRFRAMAAGHRQLAAGAPASPLSAVRAPSKTSRRYRKKKPTYKKKPTRFSADKGSLQSQIWNRRPHKQPTKRLKHIVKPTRKRPTKKTPTRRNLPVRRATSFGLIHLPTLMSSARTDAVHTCLAAS